MSQIFDHSYGIVPVYLGDGEPLYLLLKQHNGYWSFPKGHPEAGETAKETALRECKEETGISTCSIFKSLPPFSIHYTFSRGDVTHHKTVTLFGATVKDKNVETQAIEIQEYAWLPYKQAKTCFRLSSNIEALDNVKKYLDSLEQGAN